MACLPYGISKSEKEIPRMEYLLQDSVNLRRLRSGMTVHFWAFYPLSYFPQGGKGGFAPSPVGEVPIAIGTGGGEFMRKVILFGAISYYTEGPDNPKSHSPESQTAA